MLQTNYDEKNVQGHRDNIANSGTTVKTLERGGYKIVNSGPWEAWHVSSNVCANGGESEGRSYTRTYTLRSDYEIISEINGG